MVVPILVTGVFAVALIAAAWLLFGPETGRTETDATRHESGHEQCQARVTGIERGDARVTVRLRLDDTTEGSVYVPNAWPGLSDLAVGSVTLVSHSADMPGMLTLHQNAPIVTVSAGAVARG